MVDKTGKIVQYLSPGYVKESGDFLILPSEFELAVEKASRGELTPTITKILQTCISYLPKGRSMMLLLMIFASGLLTITTVFIIIKKVKVKRKF